MPEGPMSRAPTLPPAILFDLDDTLITAHLHPREAWHRAIDGLPERPDGLDVPGAASAIHEAARWFWSDPDRHREGRLDIHTTRRRIVSRGLARHFVHVQIEGEMGFGKPEEQAYAHALAALGTAPSDTWIVGDNLDWEVIVPQRLGFHAIWRDPVGKGMPAGHPARPDRIITRLAELLQE